MRTKARAKPATRPEEFAVPSQPKVTAHEAILNAAEEVFGTHGFDGGSMRDIAEKAGVAQALLHYHFKNKDKLYSAVFERRANMIRGERGSHLKELFAGGDEVTLEDILDILFMSLEELIGTKRGDMRFYLQMLAEVTMSTSERSVEIVKRCYDPSAEQFIKAFQDVLPGLTRERAVWAYLFSIGARMQAHSPSDRAARLGATRKARWAYSLLVPFVAAGIRAIAREDRHNAALGDA